jgi:trehalose 6-phosphate synthase/phosphatase
LLAIFVPENYEIVQYHYAVFSGGLFVRYEGKPHHFIRKIHLDKSETPLNSTSDILDTPSTQISEVNAQCAVALSSVDYSGEYRKRLFCNSSQRSSCPLDSTDSVVVVSYFLPIIITKDANKNWIVQWNIENLLSLTTALRVSWVGSIPQRYSLTQQDEEILSVLLLEMSCYPVFLSRKVHREFYNIFCKQYVWPVLHHNYDPFGPIDKKKLDSTHEQSLWYICTTVHQLFCRKIVEVYQTGDLVWIHGFHLMLLPSYVRRKISGAKIGIFLHTPFPSSEIWKTLWCREDFLLGILCADQIGFHLFEYARHFLTTCRRLLGTHYQFNSSGSLIIQAGGRDVLVTCFHVGANNPLIDKIQVGNDFILEASSLSEKYKDRLVITSE